MQKAVYCEVSGRQGRRRAQPARAAKEPCGCAAFRSPPSSALLQAAQPQGTFAALASLRPAPALPQFTFVNIFIPWLYICKYTCTFVKTSLYKCEFTFVNRLHKQLLQLQLSPSAPVPCILWHTRGRRPRPVAVR